MSLHTDIQNLKTGKVRLEHLINRESGVHLDHQAKRAIAHLGLQIFSNVIAENKGLIRASSPLYKSLERDPAIVARIRMPPVTCG